MYIQKRPSQIQVTNSQGQISRNQIPTEFYFDGESQNFRPCVERNWWEIQVPGAIPPMRAYHGSFLHKRKLFIMGGNDIDHGLMNDVWHIDLCQLTEFVPDETEFIKNPEWQQAKCSGISKPKPIFGHTCNVFGDKMYMFGGNLGGIENKDMYTLELNKFQWQIVKAKPANGEKWNMPGPRDEHTSVQLKDILVIFGGYADGKRLNEMYQYHVKDNVWMRVNYKGTEVPCPRSGHSASLRQAEDEPEQMYIFGGKDQKNRKLDDFWKYDFQTQTWTEIVIKGGPSPRAGHSSSIYDDYMIIYGGIFDITRELNDMHIYSFEKDQWICLFNQTQSPQPKSFYAMSPSPYKSSNNRINERSLAMMTLYQTQQKMPSTFKSSFLSIRPGDGAYTGPGSIADKLQIKPPNHRLGLPLNRKKKPDYEQNKPTKGLKPLRNEVDPRIYRADDSTSHLMKNSYIIKNEDPSFEKAFAVIQKRHRSSKNSSLKASPAKQNESSPNKMDRRTKLNGRRPPARDGHSSLVVGSCLFIFGGDRHHMPFNDLFLLDLLSEFENNEMLNNDNDYQEDDDII